MWKKIMGEKDAVREERISNEATVDAYGSEERALGWYCYLDDKITFPFSAICICTDRRNPLELNERVTVSKMANEEDCENDMYVEILRKKKVMIVPLFQLNPVKADDETVEAVEDWHYWKAQGYLF